MRIVCDRQQTEEWEHWRRRPTASEFDKFVTPARGDYSSQATGYAAKIVAKQLGVYEEPQPTFAMDRGTELEPSAKLAYTKQTGLEIQEVGFVLPDHTDAYGCSPDGLVGDDGGLEVKCPSAEKVILWRANGQLPVEFRPQVQGSLFITGRKWWDFYGWHPELEPFLLRVMPDIEYQTKIAECLLLLLEEIKRIQSLVRKQRHQVLPSPLQADLRFDDE